MSRALPKISVSRKDGKPAEELKLYEDYAPKPIKAEPMDLDAPPPAPAPPPEEEDKNKSAQAQQEEAAKKLQEFRAREVRVKRDAAPVPPGMVPLAQAKAMADERALEANDRLVNLFIASTGVAFVLGVGIGWYFFSAPPVVQEIVRESAKEGIKKAARGAAKALAKA